MRDRIIRIHSWYQDCARDMYTLEVEPLKESTHKTMCTADGYIDRFSLVPAFNGVR